MSQFQTVCKSSEIADGEARSFRLGENVIGVFRVGGQVYAIDDRCPHAGASLAQGHVDGDVVRCRIHHWGFCLRDGVHVDEDKPQSNVRSFPARIANGAIQVCVD